MVLVNLILMPYDRDSEYLSSLDPELNQHVVLVGDLNVEPENVGDGDAVAQSRRSAAILDQSAEAEAAPDDGNER